MNDMFWIIVGKLGLVVGVLLTVLQIIRWFKAPVGRLRSWVSLHPFDLPFVIDDQFKEIRSQHTQEAYNKLLDINWADIGERHKDEILRRLSWHADSTLPDRIPYRLNAFGNMWIADVINHGNTSIENVRILLPGTKLATILREGNVLDKKECEDVISIGNLGPREKVAVKAWADHAGEWAFDKIQLTHKTGVGSVCVMLPARRFWSIIERNIWQIGFIVVQIFFIFFAIFLSFFKWKN